MGWKAAKCTTRMGYLGSNGWGRKERIGAHPINHLLHSGGRNKPHPPSLSRLVPPAPLPAPSPPSPPLRSPVLSLLASLNFSLPYPCPLPSLPPRSFPASSSPPPALRPCACRLISPAEHMDGVVWILHTYALRVLCRGKLPELGVQDGVKRLSMGRGDEEVMRQRGHEIGLWGSRIDGGVGGWRR